MTEAMMWKYAEGTWTRVPDPLGEFDDYDEALAQLGFREAESWGFTTDDVRIFEHDSDERWRIDVNVNGSVVRTIEVTRLPDLLDILAKLAAIVTASILSFVGNTLQPAVFNLREDAQAELGRRRRLSRDAR